MGLDLLAVVVRLQAKLPGMAQRLLAAAQDALARDLDRPQVSYTALVLRVAAADWQEGFVRSVRSAMGSGSVPDTEVALWSLATDAAHAPDPLEQALQQSTAAYHRLLAAARSAGAVGVQALGGGVFVAGLRAGIEHARLDAASAQCLMPYLCRALDKELLALYTRLLTPPAASK